MKSNQDKIRRSIAFLSVWTGFMLLLYMLTDISWFHLGDFHFRTAMAYHGILIPVWLMLALAYSQHLEKSVLTEKRLYTGALSAAVLTGIGSVWIRHPGLTFGTVIQVTGMVVAEITVWIILILSFRQYNASKRNINTVGWWAVTIGLLGMLLATPLGHLAGIAKDFNPFSPMLKQASALGLTPQEILDGYITSHSHQILAAFLTIGFTLPLMRKNEKKTGLVFYLEKTGLYVVILATIVQVVLYQYCAWAGWEPPVLFSHGPNGIPLDDFILSLLGFGWLLLLPGLLFKNKNLPATEKITCRMTASLLVIYLISVVALGLFIEFHEQYFGFGENQAPGILNDQAFIRAHLLFGFMIIPVFLGIFLNANLLNSNKKLKIALVFAILTLITGFAGLFVWTFFLNALVLHIAVVLTALFLFLFGIQIYVADNHKQA